MGGGRGDGKSVFNGDTVLVLHDGEISGDGWWQWLCNSVSVLNAAGLYTQNWLRWEIFYGFYKKKIGKNPMETQDKSEY